MVDGEEKEVDKPIRSSQEAYALYFTFRMQVLQELKACSDLLRKIMQESGDDNSDYPNSEEFMELKSRMVASLYFLVCDKIEYPKSHARFRPLYNLTRYYNTSANIKNMSLSTTKQYLMLLRSLIEALGYTKVERRKDTEDYEVMLASAEGVI